MKPGQKSHSLSLSYLESMLEEYQDDPRSVPDDWRDAFDELVAEPHSVRFRSRPSLLPAGLFGAAARTNGHGALPHASLQSHVDDMIRAYRTRGHFGAAINPLVEPVRQPDLEPAAFGIREHDLAKPVATANMPGPEIQSIAHVLQRLKSTYCGAIGAEFMHIDDFAVREWIYERLELPEQRLRLGRDEQLRILRRLVSASVFEDFIQKKYLGAKSFSLEGGETLIPLLELAIDKCATFGVSEIVLGMAHRGRLNVLCNILGKSPKSIFREFEDVDPETYYGSGDVKYHMGYSSDWQAANGQSVHLSLSFNPSHLEFINPVVLGRVKAKQSRVTDGPPESRVVPILIHGDAAFAGEGVVQETLNLSQLDGYAVGGTLHVILNNQIGFTTSPDEARSNTYATDVAKMLQIPIFHVSGEEPEAVAQVIDVALDFRQQFGRDVVIDMYCYRRRGHNEGDEPAFTQPLLYEHIRARQPVQVHYREHLLQLGEVTREEAESLITEQEQELETALASARAASEKQGPQAYDGVWRGFQGGPDADVPDIHTGLPLENVQSLLERLTVVPDGFEPHPKLERFLAARRDMASGARPLDWAAAEAVAFASLVSSGTGVRLSGQDCQRGTFSHRHAVLHDHKTGETYTPLMNLSEQQATVEILNSPLSEAGVLGFDYGYSLDFPDGLVIWEAQFGDFSNAAQVVIDQFLTSAEDKWNRLSGIVLLLPHGFEGQGPEHSSARLERWLSLAAEDNIQIIYPTTPAQYFYALRRQVMRPFRKPLVVMTPKSMLRNPAVVSDRDELVDGMFRRVLADVELGPEQSATTDRILLCSGKIYYELEERRRELEQQNVAIVRLEQLYPMPVEPLSQALSAYPDGTPVVWVQEEPRNMGAWPYLRLNWGERILDRFPLSGVYREESASPATGSLRSHQIEQEEIISAAFAGL